MNSWLRSWHGTWSKEDALADFRERIALSLCAFAALLLLPFSVNHLLAGRWQMACLLLLVQGMLWATGLSLFRGRKPLLPLWAMACTILGVGLLSIPMLGMPGVLWAFPTLFIGYFVLARRVALLLSLVQLIAAPALVAVWVDPDLALRLFGSLALTLVMINVVLNVINDLQSALLQQAITDPLTGAYNRRHLDAQLSQIAAVPAQAGADRAAGGSNVVMAIDIDHFKAINDRHGHAAGDAVLKATVGLLGTRKRHTDMLFRTGGEEFLLLLPRISEPDAKQLAEDLRRLMEQAPLLPDQPVTVSIGVSAQRPGQGVRPWLDSADAALYEAKRSGRNRVVSATSPLAA